MFSTLFSPQNHRHNTGALLLKLFSPLLLAVCLPCRAAPPEDATAASALRPDEEGGGVRRFFTQDYLLGDWGGGRPWLSKHGVDFEFFYVGAVPSNVSGGLRRGSVYEGLLLMTLDLYSDKLVGYEGGRFHAGSLWIHGNEFSKDYIGDLNKVSLIDFPEGWRLWELWYEQQFWDKKVSLKLGQLAIDQDFLVAEYSKIFINQTFWYPTLAFNIYDIPGFPARHHALAATPYGAPGVRLKLEPVEAVYLQAGVYDGNPDRSGAGTDVKLNEDEGALAYFEAGYRLNQRPTDQGLPGTYKVGAFYHTGDFGDIYDTVGGMFGFTAGNRALHPNNYGVYLQADQMVYRETPKSDPAEQGLGAFFRTAAAPSDRNLTQFEIDGGLVYKGLIPSRDYDSLGVAASYLEISDDIRRAQRAANQVVPGYFVESDYEAVLEFTYKAQLAAWWTVQPSVEWVMHPGGSKDIPDAVAVLLFTTLRF